MEKLRAEKDREAEARALSGSIPEFKGDTEKEMRFKDETGETFESLTIKNLVGFYWEALEALIEGREHGLGFGDRRVLRKFVLVKYSNSEKKYTVSQKALRSMDGLRTSEVGPQVLRV